MTDDDIRAAIAERIATLDGVPLHGSPNRIADSWACDFPDGLSDPSINLAYDLRCRACRISARALDASGIPRGRTLIAGRVVDGVSMGDVAVFTAELLGEPV